MATRRADDRPKRDIPDGEDEVPLDASALMEHLRDMETKLNLVCPEFSTPWAMLLSDPGFVFVLRLSTSLFWFPLVLLPAVY